ncbi:lutropin-choriogonadotropic hormone receptor-like [Thrips palmi]|uniref:Lutropin-choriogonadotropic hormone receptor-like n=1 Tax=Thrips palmi TaxID=161013 RepID=A0A6P8YXT7_THRPL|nr:lutropin-choriogonadotropic hormone receptor-like [Thrips palmi]
MYALDPRLWDGCACDDAEPASHHDPYAAAHASASQGYSQGYSRRLGSGLSCSCSGAQLLSIPQQLTRSRLPVRSLVVEAAGTQTLKASDLDCCRRDLQDLTLADLKNLTSIESGILHDMGQLRTLELYRLQKLTHIPHDVFNVAMPRLRLLRIMQTGLKHLPPLNMLAQILEIVEFEGNDISFLSSHSVAVRTSMLNLGYNLIEHVAARAFDTSQIARLSLKGNANLRTLHQDAFLGIDSLRHLDLSSTSITDLPTRGLENLEHLLLQDTHLLKVFPAAFHFKALQVANLTYPYHCCAFSFPAQHRPQEYANYQEKLREAQARCSALNSSNVVAVAAEGAMQPLAMFLGPAVVDSRRTAGWEEETFHLDNVTLHTGVLEAVCGALGRPRPPVTCSPEPDAFSPCEDLMGNWLLRLSVWAVSVAALVGNGTVLLVLLSPRRRLSVPRYLMCHLAAADLAMGAYLLMLAVMDAVSIGAYFNYAIDWQNGMGCQVAGFLTVFASELSVFTLTLLTTERWYTITFAIHMNRRLRLGTAMRIMAAGWVYSVVMALLPLVGVSGYYVTSICLPLRSLMTRDRAYLGALLAFTALAFTVICACYCRMYSAVRGGQDARAAMQRSDVTRCAVQVAKRMTLLVLTDFACWAPIAFFGVTALLGAPLIDVPRTKILLVFFYPLNACANPYLYALLTRQFRNDLVTLLGRYKFFATRAAKYKGGPATTPRESSRRVDPLSGAALAHRALHTGQLATASGLVPAKQRDDSTELELVLVERSRVARTSIAALPPPVPEPVKEPVKEAVLAVEEDGQDEADDAALATLAAPESSAGV